MANHFWNKMSALQKGILIALCGAIVGLAGTAGYLLRMHTYLGDDSSACVNCHLMTPYYATWQHSSHSRNATCNDCHVPHQNVVQKYGFKALDGSKHVAMLLTGDIRQVPEAQEMSKKVIMDNCIRCHTETNTTLVSTGQIDYMATTCGKGKACWDCHRDIPHGGKNSLCATPDAKVPVPAAPVPEWLQNRKK